MTKSPDWRPVRPFHDFPRADPEPFDTRQSIFVPDQSISNSQLAGDISPLKIQLIGTKIYNSSNQTITTVVPTLITFDTEVFDTMAGFTASANTKITVPYTGIYSITVSVRWAANAATGYRRTRLFVNGANAETSAMFPASGTGTGHSIASLRKLTAGDYLEVEVTHDRGANLDVVGGEDDNSLSCVFLGTV